MLNAGGFLVRNFVKCGVIESFAINKKIGIISVRDVSNNEDLVYHPKYAILNC